MRPLRLRSPPHNQFTFHTHKCFRGVNANIRHWCDRPRVSPRFGSRLLFSSGPRVHASIVTNSRTRCCPVLNAKWCDPNQPITINKGNCAFTCFAFAKASRPANRPDRWTELCAPKQTNWIIRASRSSNTMGQKVARGAALFNWWRSRPLKKTKCTARSCQRICELNGIDLFPSASRTMDTRSYRRAKCTMIRPVTNDCTLLLRSAAAWLLSFRMRRRPHGIRHSAISV